MRLGNKPTHVVAIWYKNNTDETTGTTVLHSCYEPNREAVDSYLKNEIGSDVSSIFFDCKPISNIKRLPILTGSV
jgi:hypothetical protein